LWQKTNYKNKLLSYFLNKRTNHFTTIKGGFSSKMINRFYAPSYPVFLENEFKTSRMFDFVMKMFSDGDVAVPELGMEKFRNSSLNAS
jgi:hypothetical protein